MGNDVIKPIDRLLPFRKSLSTLCELESEPYSKPIRDAWIQRFEYTLEQSWRVLQKLLKERGLEVASPRETCRLAAREGLLSNVQEWLLFIEKRNLTSHTYNEDVANEVFEIIPQFIVEAKILLGTLESQK